MGYFHNNLSTLITGVFAAILTGIWPMFVGIAPVLNFVFIMAVPIAWFITFMCWIVQKGTDYSHKYSTGSLKKNHNNPLSTVIKYTSEGKQVTSTQISDAKTQLVGELDQLRSSIKLKDSEIERLNQEIANLQTMVQIESLKSELANLKMQAAKKPNRKAKN
jgi:predicted membrane protein